MILMAETKTIKKKNKGKNELKKEDKVESNVNKSSESSDLGQGSRCICKYIGTLISLNFVIFLQLRGFQHWLPRTHIEGQPIPPTARLTRDTKNSMVLT